MTSFLLGLRICKLNLQYRKQCELETGLLKVNLYEYMDTSVYSIKV